MVNYQIHLVQISYKFLLYLIIDYHVKYLQPRAPKSLTPNPDVRGCRIRSRLRIGRGVPLKGYYKGSFKGLYKGLEFPKNRGVPWGSVWDLEALACRDSGRPELFPVRSKCHGP